ncbi:MAG: radical SAM protein [Gammaproteobacteria bacterium]|nr:radical SAM protein [Gammaproteobacteria bacterium]
MKILLVYPNAERELIGYMDLGAIAEPIALEYVAAAGRRLGHDVRLLDLRLHVHDLDSTLLDYQPDVVGVTGYSMHVLRNLEVCARAKTLVPECKTVVGGHHVTLEPVDYFEPQMDFLVIGEGIIAFQAILNRLQGGEPVAGIPGVWSRVDGSFRFGGPSPHFDIDSLPVPDRSLVPTDRSEYHIDDMKPVALARTTVGCPYRCSFCSLWRIMDGHYYKRDLDDVAREFAAIPERYIHLSDDEPFVNQRRMMQLADRLEAHGVDKNYYAYCRIDTFLKNRELMRRWRDLGLNRLFFGVETIFDHELAQYNKRQKRDQIVEALALARQLDIRIFANFIIHPSYTEKEFDEVKRFIREQEVEYPSFTIWTPIPGIEDGGTNYDQVLELQDNGRPDWSQFDLQHAVIKTARPKHEFFALYGSLYEVSPHGKPTLAAQNEAPMAKERQYRWQEFKDMDEQKREAAHIALALKLLGGGIPPSA